MKAIDLFLPEIIDTDGLRGLRRYGTEIVSGGICAHMDGLKMNADYLELNQAMENPPPTMLNQMLENESVMVE